MSSETPSEGLVRPAMEWGYVARSVFLFLQLALLFGVTAILWTPGAIGIVLRGVSSFLAVVLLFRQIDGLVETKTGE